jgi:hypothetical protein
MSAGINPSREDAQLFFRAACCLISADGKVRSQELTVLSQAMSRMGHPHTPDQLKTLVLSTCKDIHGKGVDAESETIAKNLRRLSGTPLAPYLQQVINALASSDGTVADRERAIASHFSTALLASDSHAQSRPATSSRSTPQPSLSHPSLVPQPLPGRSDPVSRASRSMQQPVASSMPRPLDWKWIFPILLVVFVLVRVRLAFMPLANTETGRPVQPRVAEAGAEKKGGTRRTWWHVPWAAEPTALTPQHAAKLAKKEGVLALNSIAAISPEVARALASHYGDLQLNGLATITPEVAEQLSKHGHTIRHRLELDGLTSLTADTAGELAKHGGILSLGGLVAISPDVAEALTYRAWPQNAIELNGLKNLGPEAARSLSKSDGGLSLNALTVLTPETAEALGAFEDVLELNGLRSLTPEVARGLAKLKLYFELNGLTALSEEAAEELAKRSGAVSLNGLVTISPGVARALAKKRGGLPFDPAIMTLRSWPSQARVSYGLILDGLESMSPAVAEELADASCQVWLGGMTTLSPDAARALAKRGRWEIWLNSLQPSYEVRNILRTRPMPVYFREP